jgi:protein FAM50
VTSRTGQDGRPKKKFKKKSAGKGLLSFGGDDDEDEDGGSAISTPASRSLRASAEPSPEPTPEARRKLIPNPNSNLPVPRALTKAALAAEAMEREKLRKDFLEIQEQVKETEIEIPFVFYDAGANVPGGSVKVKKGDHVWLFLERCRKVGAELGVSGADASGASTLSKSREDSRRQWARVGVDDLMLVKGEVIVPHHYEFYYFIANKVPDPSREGRLLFEYSGTADVKKSSKNDEVVPASLLRVPGQKKEILEGHDDDPTLTKVVDRRWYEKNKHIYPASVWKEFKVGKEFEQMTKGGRKDAQGNSFFFG